LNEIDWYYEKKISLTYLTKIMENAYNLYKNDESILFDIIKTISTPDLQESDYYQIPLLNFFNNTSKRDLVFRELLKRNKHEKIKNERILALLVTEQTIEYLLSDINSEKSKTDWIYHINVSCNDLKDKVFSRIILSRKQHDNSIGDFLLMESNFKQNSFNLLFDPPGFKSALDIFIDNFEKEKITKDDVNLLIKENYTGKNRFKTPECILSLLQIVTNRHKEISVSQFRDLKNDEEKIRNFHITKIRQSIYNNDRLEIDKKQIEYLKYWVLDILSRHSFDKLNLDIKYCIVDFSVRFDFDLPFDVLTQLLTFESYVKGKDSCFNWLKTKLSKGDMVRIIKDLLTTNQNLPDRVLLNYFRYLNELHEKNISHFILTAIKNITFDQHHRICFIDEYIKSGDSLRQLKLAYDDNDTDIKWHLLNRLIKKGESDFVLKILNKNISDQSISREDRLETIRLLVRMEEDLGFLLYLSEVRESNVANMDHRDVIKDIRNPESISFLFSLLELCLKNENPVDIFKRIASEVIRVIENIAFDTYNNYIRIASEYDNLIQICPNERPYLLSLKSGLKDRYYRNKSEKRSISEVKSLIKQIEL
jgi:hypothetical protein